MWVKTNMTNLYCIGKIKGLSEINLPMKNEFGCQTSVLREVQLLIEPHVVQQGGTSGAVLGLEHAGGALQVQE